MSLFDGRRRLVTDRYHRRKEVLAGIVYTAIVAAAVAIPLIQMSLSLDVLLGDDERGAAFRAQRIEAIAASGIFLLGLICVWVIFSAMRAKALSGPLVRITRHIHDVSAGRLDHRLNLRSRDELQALADAMNRMTAGLQDRDDTIKAGILNQIQLAQAALKTSDSTEQAALALERLARSVEHAYEAPDPALNKAVENLLGR
jgi:methyl-accepting chemotaxis protein